MINVTLRNGVCLLAIAGSMACTKNTLNLPEPAQTVAGIYKAQLNPTLFPNQVDDITLTINTVNNDTVGVQLKATYNGQAVDSLQYPKALIATQFSNYSSIRNVCVGYAIYLTPGQSVNRLTMTCQEENVFSYVYSPPGQSNTVLLKFKKI